MVAEEIEKNTQNTLLARKKKLYASAKGRLAM